MIQINKMIKLISQFIFQPVRPFETTQPVNFQFKPGLLYKLLSLKPLSTFIFRSSRQRERFTNRYVNERIVEIPFIFHHLPTKLPTQVLDIGCCESTLSLSLASLGYQVTGVDIRPYELTHPNLSFIQGDICEINFKKKRFDTIISLSTLEHIGLNSMYGSPATKRTSDILTISIIHKLLKPKGSLLLTVPSARLTYEDQFMRAYTPKQLNKMLALFTNISIQYFKADIKKNNWVPCQAQNLDTYPNFGVALIKAVK